MEKKGKTVLILGNGFDLNHCLPTRYCDFLDFCRKICYICDYEDESYCWTNLPDEINQIIEDTEYDDIIEIYDKIKNNFWIDYFKWCYMDNQLKGENWIDFELEMSSVIKWLDFKIENLTTTYEECIHILKKDKEKDSEFLNCEKKEKLIYLLGNKKENLNKIIMEAGYAITESISTMKDIRNFLYQDLTDLICSLNIYLSQFVSKLDIDRQKLFYETIQPDFVLNFNYTNTYEKVYNSEIPIQYIHGKITSEGNESENIVLGIDEYLGKENQNNKVNYSIFKKFVQRIRNDTGNNYKEIIKKIESIYQKVGNVCSGEKNPMIDYSDGISFVHIFGHSLDITDKDILVEFIKSEATVVIIYCKDKFAEGEAIENILKLIDEEILIDKYLSMPSKFKFVILEDEMF